MTALRTAIAILTLFWCGVATAQQPTSAQKNALRQSCSADFQAHCGGVSPGGQAALACLQQNAASLSPACGQAVAAISQPSRTTPPPTSHPAASSSQMSPRDELAVARSACGPDYRAYCRGLRPGGGRALACLEAHEASLSRACQAVLRQAASHANR